MRGKTVLICSADSRLVKALQRALERCGCHVLEASDAWWAGVALDAGGVSLVVVDVPTIQDSYELIDRSHVESLVICLTAGDNIGQLRRLVSGIGVGHVIARPNQSSESLVELLISANKLLNDDLFGLDKYLRGEEVDIRRATLTCAQDRDMQLSALSDFLRQHKAPRQAISTIVNAADEMLTNAIYNAPIDKHGLPRYAATNRRLKIALGESEHVQLSYALHKGMFGMSVSDQFGRLRFDHFRKSIARCTTALDPIEQKAGGAGLGLFMLAQTAHQFVVNCSADNHTEVIALWNLDRKRLREQRSHNSFHFFEEAYRLETPLPSRLKRPMGTRAPTDDWEPTSTIPGMGVFGCKTAVERPRFRSVDSAVTLKIPSFGNS